MNNSSPSPRSKLVRALHWAGLRGGDAVVVDAPRERRRHWVFVAHVRNELSGEEWIEVRGGRSGEAKSRAFRPELIYPAGARRGSRLVAPSLVDAPQLALFEGCAPDAATASRVRSVGRGR